MKDIELKTIEYNTKDYEEFVELRQVLLRRVIGYPIETHEIEEEKDDIFIAAYDTHKIIIGCCILTDKSGKTIQLRQMAVAPEYRSKNIGKGIVSFAEQIAAKKGFSKIILHARDYAMDFYKKQGYSIEGEKFEEVGITHYIMTKNI